MAATLRSFCMCVSNVFSCSTTLPLQAGVRKIETKRRNLPPCLILSYRLVSQSAPARPLPPPAPPSMRLAAAALLLAAACCPTSAFPVYASVNGSVTLESAFGGDVVFAPSAGGALQALKAFGAPYPSRSPAAGSVFARGLLHATNGLQLNGTKLDESLLSGLAAVVAGLAEQLEASTTLQSASLANVTAALAATRADQAAAVANVTAALAETQVRWWWARSDSASLPERVTREALTRPPGHARQRHGNA